MPRFIALLLLLTLGAPALAAPRVLTSIRPLQLIASELMQGIGSAEALLDPGQSPHHFQLRPSQLRKLQNADLLVWIDDDFETGLARLQNSLPAGAERLQLMPLLGMAGPEPGDADTARDGHEHEANAHVWLSPRHDRRIAELLAERLARIDPAHAADYARNRDRLIRRLQDWQTGTAQRLADARPRYLLDHPFLDGFEDDLGIRAIGSLAGINARGGSLKRLKALESTLRDTPADCLFSADWPADRRSRQFARQFGLKLEWLPILDPRQKARSIVDLLDGIAQRMLDCTRPKPAG